MRQDIVAKFGGSSLATGEQFNKVKNIINQDANRKYIVVSAPGKRNKKDFKITDILYLCHDHISHGIDFDDVFKLIVDRYTGLKKDLNLDIDIDKYLTEIRSAIESGASRDYIASRGEYLNALILADYLKCDFVDAGDIIKFKKHGTLDYEATDRLIYETLKDKKRVVIPGFYGSLPNGEIKTFSRGGSDVTGSLVARAVRAKLYENWTDVSGFMMADPTIVQSPKAIEKITYRELRELSYMGANVLHEDAMFPIRSSGIPIHIKNTNRPQDEGTLIVSDLDINEATGSITGIAGKKNFSIIAIEKSKMNYESGFCRKLLSILETFGIQFENMPSGIDTVSLVISDEQLNDKLDDVLEEINRQCRPDSLEVYSDISLIAVVGQGMVRSKGTSSKVFDSLANSSVNVRMINQGSSEINIIVGVENNDFEKSINSIYNAFAS